MTIVLQKGARGTEIEALQKKLNSELKPSPNLKPDGIFGANTHRAVLTFQKKNWLVEDGDVGPCTWAALQGTEKYNVLHKVNLVPQIDSSGCWLAATSMLLGRSVTRSHVPSSLMHTDGGILNDSELLSPVHIRAYAQHFHLRMHYPQSWSAAGLANVLVSSPVSMHILWDISGYVSGSGSSGHFVILAGIRGDGTAIGTTLRIYDPWPPNRGKIRSYGYQKLTKNTPGYTYQLFKR